MKSKYAILGTAGCFALGVILGIASKYLDTISVTGSDWTISLHFFADLFTRLGIWVLLATAIAAFSKSYKMAALNVFVFFIGMLISYYVYSAYLFGFFPSKDFMHWGSIALVSPVMAIIVWQARNNRKLNQWLPAVPMGLMLSLSLSVGLFYISVNRFEELIMYFIMSFIFYKNSKQIIPVFLFSIIVGIIIDINPFISFY